MTAGIRRPVLQAVLQAEMTEHSGHGNATGSADVARASPPPQLHPGPYGTEAGRCRGKCRGTVGLGGAAAGQEPLAAPPPIPNGPS